MPPQCFASRVIASALPCNPSPSPSITNQYIAFAYHYIAGALHNRALPLPCLSGHCPYSAVLCNPMPPHIRAVPRHDVAIHCRCLAPRFNALPMLLFAAPTPRLAVLRLSTAYLCQCLAVRRCSTASRCETCLCRCWAKLRNAIAIPIGAMPSLHSVQVLFPCLLCNLLPGFCVFDPFNIIGIFFF